MTDVIDFPGKESAMDKKPHEIARERLYALEHALQELEKVPLATLAALRFERQDCAQVGANWCLQHYGSRIAKLQTRIELESDRRKKTGVRNTEELKQTT
jgi:hypothetical protein